MDKNRLWSLRLGFSGRNAKSIEKLGLETFLDRSFQSDFEQRGIPPFLEGQPSTPQELRAYQMSRRTASEEEKLEFEMKRRRAAADFRGWWIEKIRKDEFPLREKMVVFWHNHFVSTFQKVRVNLWLYQHNQTLRENAFGNFRDLTKKMVRSNAMVRYLDNVDNRKGRINENLSRELLELFTLGIGNYSEADIKNGAKGLAGLGYGREEAMYRPFQTDQDEITYFGRKGTFKADELVDIIFEQPAVPYLLTEKILKWFVYDTPSAELIQYYGDYFRQVDFEVKPLLKKIFLEEFPKNNAASKIKDPLVFVLQLVDELNMSEIDNVGIAYFIQQQGMDLHNQQNVKGWDGGQAWLTPQILLQRNRMADMMCRGMFPQRQPRGAMQKMRMQPKSVKISLDWNRSQRHKKIIDDLKGRLLTIAGDELQEELETVLKYDFNPKAENAEDAVLRLFNFIVKTPEFHLI